MPRFFDDGILILLSNLPRVYHWLVVLIYPKKHESCQPKNPKYGWNTINIWTPRLRKHPLNPSEMFTIHFLMSHPGSLKTESARENIKRSGRKRQICKFQATSQISSMLFHFIPCYSTIFHVIPFPSTLFHFQMGSQKIIWEFHMFTVSPRISAADHQCPKTWDGRRIGQWLKGWKSQHASALCQDLVNLWRISLSPYCYIVPSGKLT